MLRRRKAGSCRGCKAGKGKGRERRMAVMREWGDVREDEEKQGEEVESERPGVKEGKWEDEGGDGAGRKGKAARKGNGEQAGRRKAQRGTRGGAGRKRIGEGEAARGNGAAARGKRRKTAERRTENGQWRGKRRRAEAGGRSKKRRVLLSSPPPCHAMPERQRTFLPERESVPPTWTRWGCRREEARLVPERSATDVPSGPLYSTAPRRTKEPAKGGRRGAGICLAEAAAKEGSPRYS